MSQPRIRRLALGLLVLALAAGIALGRPAANGITVEHETPVLADPRGQSGGGG